LARPSAQRLFRSLHAAEHIGFVDSSSSFNLTLLSPGTERARVPVDNLEIERHPGAWLALGFLVFDEPMSSLGSFVIQ
jgi:hypothetical protein